MCLRCQAQCLITDNFINASNDIMSRLGTRINLDFGAALFNYTKAGHIQNVVHKLKYKGRKDIAFKVGKLFGAAMSDSPLFKRVDVLVPIPIHHKRKKERGYNQAEQFALGIDAVLNVGLETRVLLKQNEQKSLTSQGRLSRFEQVKRSFCLSMPEILKDKNILICDDVLTTGATVEAAAELLLNGACQSIQCALIAIAKM